jgi:hypothetical protein
MPIPSALAAWSSACMRGAAQCPVHHVAVGVVIAVIAIASAGSHLNTSSSSRRNPVITGHARSALPSRTRCPPSLTVCSPGWGINTAIPLIHQGRQGRRHRRPRAHYRTSSWGHSRIRRG